MLFHLDLFQQFFNTERDKDGDREKRAGQGGKKMGGGEHQIYPPLSTNGRSFEDV